MAAPHARVEGGDVRGEGPAPGVAHAADAFAIDFRQRCQVVDGADAVPDAVAGQVGPKQVEGIAEDRVFTTGEIETRLLLLGVPELAAFPLADGVIGQNDVAALDQVDVQDLIGGGRLALGRVATGADDAGQASLIFLGLYSRADTK
jgi:hypothetical protein